MRSAPDRWWLLALPGLALLGLLLPSYHDISLGLWRQEQNAYLPWLSILSLWLFWYRGRSPALAPSAKLPLPGMGLLMLGLAGYVLGRSQRIELIELAALVPVLAGVIVILGGATFLRQMRFPLLFLLFALPYPGSVIDSLTSPLKEWISFGSASLLHHAGYPIARSGVVLVLWPYRLLAANGYLYRSAPGYFSPGAEFNPMLHTWSLAVEEQFYFIFPLLLGLAWRLGTGRQRPNRQHFTAAIFILGMLGTSFWIGCAMSYGTALLPGVSSPGQFAFYASPTRAWEFAAGALLALCSGWLKRLPSGLTLAAGAGGLLLMGWSAFWIDGSMPFPGWIAWAPVAATQLMLISGAAEANWVTRLLSLRAAVWIGDRSYGWYLWHWPFVVFARALLPGSGWALVVASVLSLLPAWASFRYIETPIRSVKQPSTRRTVALAAICVLAPMLAFAALLIVNRAIEASAGARQISSALQLHADEVRHCEGIQALLPGQRERCTWHAPQARGTVLLLGDSNAGHFTEPVVQAANAAGYDVTVATLAACPFVDLKIYSNGLPNHACQSFVANAAAEIAHWSPSLIVLATASDGYIEEPSTTLRVSDDAPLARTPDDKAKLWSLGLSSVLSRLNRSAPVLLVHPVPRFRTWTLASCAAYKVWLDPLGCAGSVGRGEVDDWRRRAVESENRAVSASPGSATLEMTGQLCSASSCEILRDDQFTKDSESRVTFVESWDDHQHEDRRPQA